MSAQISSAADPPLRLAVRLDAVLGTVTTSAETDVRDSVEHEVAAMLGELGIPGRPDVQVTTVERLDGAAPVALSVDGRRCRFPLALIRQVLGYLRGEPPTAATADVAGLPAGLVGKFVGLLCRAAITIQPAVLLTREASDCYHSRLDAEGTPPDGDVFKTLFDAIDLAVPINDHAVVGAALTDGFADGGSAAERLIAAAAPATIDLHVEPGYLRSLTTNGDGGREALRLLRDGLTIELGLPLGRFHLIPDGSLSESAFAFGISGLQTLPQIGLPPGKIMVNDWAERLTLGGVEAQPMLNPHTLGPAALVDQEHQVVLENQGYTTWNGWGYLVLSFAAALRSSAHRLMNRQRTDALLAQLGQSYPKLVDATRAAVPLDLITKVLRELLLDRIPIANLPRILAFLLKYETGRSPDEKAERVEYVRAGLADRIAHTASHGTGTVVVYLLAPAIESAVTARLVGSGETEVADGLPDRLVEALHTELTYLPQTAQVPAVLTQDFLRRPIRDLLRFEFPRLAVISYRDLPPDCNVQPVARIDVS